MHSNFKTCAWLFTHVLPDTENAIGKEMIGAYYDGAPNDDIGGFFNGTIELSFSEENQVISNIRIRNFNLELSDWSKRMGITNLGKMTSPR